MIRAAVIGFFFLFAMVGCATTVIGISVTAYNTLAPEAE